MLRIALIEDDPHFAKILEEGLKLQPDIYLSLMAPSVEVFWETVPARFNPNVLLVDIDLPGQSGVEALPKLRKRFPETEIVMLTQIEDSDIMLRAFHFGANGYLNKNFNILQLPSLLHSLASGAALISPLMARKLIQHFKPDAQPLDGEETPLTAKETQILRLFDKGHSYEEAAAILDLKLDGLRYHVRNIYKKLNVNNKLDAIKTTKGRL